MQDVEADVTLLNTLKPLVNIPSPEVKAIKDGAILMGEESCQLEHPLPPLPGVHSNPLTTLHSQPTKRVVGWQGHHQLHAALVNAVCGHHLSHRVSHPQAHIFRRRGCLNGLGLLPPQQGRDNRAGQPLHSCSCLSVFLLPPVSCKSWKVSTNCHPTGARQLFQLGCCER